MNKTGPQNRTNKKPAESHAPGKVRSVLGYAFGPNLGQSVRPLVESFHFFRMTIAMLFLSSGMLDRTHPFFQPNARFTIGDIFRETLVRVNWRDQNRTPQNLFFLAVWGLLALCGLWLVVFVLSLIAGVSPAHAADAPGPLFSINENDLATQFIDSLIQGTQIPAGTLSDGTARAAGPITGMIQSALRAMLEFYSSAILVFASFLLLYHVINMVVRAAWSGKALEGAAQLWAPLRLVIAIMLLVPISGGLNSAQLLTLEIAKLGSSIATRAWQTFGAALTAEENASEHMMASLRGVEEPVRRMMIVYGCMADVNIQLHKTASAVEEESGGALAAGTTGMLLGGLTGLIFPPLGLAVAGVSAAATATAIVLDNTIVEKVNDNHPRNERLISVGSLRNPNLCGLVSMPAAVSASSTTPTDTMRAAIQNAIATHSETLRQNIKQSAACMAATHRAKAPRGGDIERAYEALCNDSGITSIAFDDLDAAKKAEIFTAISDKVGTAMRSYYTSVSTAVKDAITTLNAENTIDQSSWVEAGAYFARLSATQYAIMSASSVSLKASYGNLMGGGHISGIGLDALRPGTRAAEADETANGGERGGGALFGLSSEQDRYFRNMLPGHADIVTSAGFQEALDNSNRPDAITQDANGAVAPNGAIGFLRDGLMGADKTAIIRMMTQDGTADPIGALFRFGHGVFTASLWLFGGGVAGSLLSAIPVIGGTVGALANLSFMLGFILLNVAFPLVFVLPVLPLVRFLGSVMSWLIGLFEAIVSMPLFALAHLNPAGDTLFAPAKRGWNWILHIAMKPILLVFGMIGVIIILPIMLYGLNVMYGTALDTMWSDGQVGPVERVLFFLAYGTFGYGFVNTSFRAIDDLSNKAMGWGNFDAYSFRDDSERVGADAGAIAQYTTSWGQQLGGGLGQIKKGVQGDIGSFNKNRSTNMQLASEAQSKKFIDDKGNLTEAGIRQFGASPKFNSSGDVVGSSGGDQAALKSFQNRAKQGHRANKGGLLNMRGVGVPGGGTQTRADVGYAGFKAGIESAKDLDQRGATVFNDEQAGKHLSQTQQNTLLDYLSSKDLQGLQQARTETEAKYGPNDKRTQDLDSYINTAGHIAPGDNRPKMDSFGNRVKRKP